MLLTDYLKEDHIFNGFKAADKAAALDNLCRCAAERHSLCYDHILRVVLEREELSSTGLGGGVALPHGKTPEVEKPTLILALAPEGVDFDSLDGQPVRIFVLILSPLVADGREHLQLLARLGGLFKSPDAVAELLAAATPAEAYDFLARRD